MAWRKHGRSLGFLFFLSLFYLLSPARPCLAGFIDHFHNPDDIGANKAPRFGHSRILVIPVNLDAKRSKPLDVKKIERFFKDTGDNRFTFANYWRINSGGQFTLEADIAKPVNIAGCPFAITKKGCTPIRRDVTALGVGVPLVREILLLAHKQSKLDFTRYDLNGKDQAPDGYIDGVVILFNQGHFGVALPFGLFDERFIFEADGVKVTVAALSSGERRLAMSVHEFGHLLGFADLYDEWRKTFGLSLSLMGNWRYRKGSVPLLDAYSKMAIGWAKVEMISGVQDVLIEPAYTGKVYRLGAGREFFLVENRQPYGAFDKTVSHPGLAVYHVNLNRSPSASPFGFIKTVVDCPNCRRWRPFIMNVQADRNYDLQYRLRRFEPADLFRTGDALLPKPNQMRLMDSNRWFASNTYAGFPTGIAITGIDSDAHLPNIRALMKAPRLKNPCKYAQCSKEKVCRKGRCIEASKASIGYPEPIAANSFRRSLPMKAAASGCFLFEEFKLDWRFLSILLLIAWLFLRKRLKKKYEEHLRKKDRLDDEEGH